MTSPTKVTRTEAPDPSVDRDQPSDPQYVETMISKAEAKVLAAEIEADRLDLAVAGAHAAVLALRAVARTKGITVRETGSPDDELLTVIEVAKILGVDKGTVYQAIRTGKGPPSRRIGKALRISRGALSEWLRTGDDAATIRRRR